MKNFILLNLILFLTTSAFSQNYKQRLDSLEFELQRIETTQTNTINKINLHSKGYRTGVIISGVGTSVAVLSVLLFRDSPVSYIGGITGGVFAITGSLISFNSFKFLNKDFDYNKYYKIKRNSSIRENSLRQ